jgi:LEA14-like dessication related protein
MSRLPLPRASRIAPILALALVAMAAFPGCGMMERRLAVRNCEFALKGVELSGLDLLGARFLVKVGVKNPNDIETVIDRFDFDFFLNDGRLAQAGTNRKNAIPPGESRIIEVDVTAGYADIARVVGILRSKDFKNYRVAGQVYLGTVAGTFTFPVEASGEFR